MTDESRYSCAKPLGGFTFISVSQICMAWSAYREGTVRLADLRVWFAVWEMAARRCRLDSKRTPEFRLAELSRLVGGVGESALKKSIRRLTKCSLLTWSASGSTFPEVDGHVPGGSFGEMMTRVSNRRRRVPVPRRTVRVLARTTRKVVFATILGHLFRCVYYRSDRCVSRGTCKASWIAAVFGVDCRNVKAARSWLAEIGWLHRAAAPQWRLNRFGGVVEVNLHWEGETKSPPRSAARVTGSPLPESNQELLAESENQKPGVPAPTGVWRIRESDRPRLGNVKREDLRSIRRVLVLYREAVERGFAQRGEAGRLAFVAGAVHAMRIGTRNPAGLFAAVVRKGLWKFITQADEEQARVRLERYFASKREITGLRRSPERNITPQRLGTLLAGLVIGN